MKKLLPLLLLCYHLTTAQTPIVFNMSNAPVAGQSQRVVIDTFPLPTINFGNPGANQAYDFSNLVQYKQDTVEYRALTSGQKANFPSADAATTLDGINFLFTNTDTPNTKLTLEGFEGLLFGNIFSASYSNGAKPDLMRFPTQYQNTFGGNASLTKTVPGSQVGQPLVTDVRLTITNTYTDTIDGWGSVKTPLGTYKCLRKKRVETTITHIEAYPIFPPAWITVSRDTSHTTRYQYLTKETMGSAVTFNYDTNDVLQSVAYSLIPPTAPVANFAWNNVSGGLVTFTDQSDFYPTAWSWTFGDGGTSNLQNPNHTYTANGNYNVCLTATNAGGSHQVCKTVNVTGISAANNPPVAFNDTLSVTGGSSTIYHVADNDVDPDGDNICMTAVWGSPFATEYIGGTCDMVQYQPDSLFEGNDTAYYSICDDGSPVLCDTGMIVFSVTASNHAPVATNNTATTTQPNPVTTNVGTDDSDPDGNNICLTEVYGSAAFSIAPTGNCTSILFEPDSTFTGSDTCWYIICDNGAPVLCDTARFIVTVNACSAPVANFTNCTGNCNGTPLVNTTQGYDSAVWIIRNPNASPAIDTVIVNADTIRLGQPPLQGIITEGNIQVCLKVYSNLCGEDSICRTITVIWGGINNVTLSNIRIYPNPANNIVTIDMRQSEEEATRNYQSIEVYNTIGEKVAALGKGQQSNLVNLNVSELPSGIYMATLTAATGERRTLGRFNVQH